MESQFDKVVDRAQPGDKVCTTVCECCGREFYLLDRERYKEAMELDEMRLVKAPKCPFCGYSGMISPGAKILKDRN